MVTKEQVKKCLDKYANDYLSTREETECFDYAIKAVDAYNEPKDGLENMIADCERHIVCKGCPHEKECDYDTPLPADTDLNDIEPIGLYE